MDAARSAPPRAIDLGTEHPFRVGGASIDPLSREARFDGGEERLQPQNLRVLIALARHRAKVVTRDQLIDLCWDGRFVGDDVISRAISTLRQFAERADGFSIETVPRAGYRLVETSRSWWTGRRVWIGAAAAVLVATASAYLLLDRPPDGAAPATPTVAILPFVADSPDPAIRELALAAHDSVAHMFSATQ